MDMLFNKTVGWESKDAINRQRVALVPLAILISLCLICRAGCLNWSDGIDLAA